MSPEEYRAQAELMRKNAAKSKDPEVRDSFLSMAADWDRLADNAEETARRQKQTPPPK